MVNKTHGGSLGRYCFDVAFLFSDVGFGALGCMTAAALTPGLELGDPRGDLLLDSPRRPSVNPEIVMTASDTLPTPKSTSNIQVFYVLLFQKKRVGCR